MVPVRRPPGYDISQLRGDISRIAFLLGADNGRELFVYQ
jgi:hypothetical protein